MLGLVLVKRSSSKLKTKIKSILFDLDGVLVDACHWHYEALNRSLSAVAGIEIEYEDHIKSFNGLPTKVKLEILKERGTISDYQIDQIWSLKQKNTIDVINDNANLDAEKILIHENLKYLNIPRVCVTNSIRETATLMLEKTGQFESISLLITNEDVKNNKPHPEAYVTAMVKMGTLPEETLIVEDSEKGMQAALGTVSHILRVKNSEEVTWDRISKILEGIR